MARTILSRRPGQLPRALAVPALAVSLSCTGSLSPPGQDTGTAPNGQHGVTDPGAQPEGQVPPPMPGCVPAPARIWKLTPPQVEQTVETLLPGVTIDFAPLYKAAPQGAAFSTWADWRDLSEPNVSVLLEFSRSLASAAAQSGASLASCAAQAPVTPDCARQIISDFGARAFRRPLAEGEATALASFFDAQNAEHGADTALRQLLSAIFLSPSFLFRSELGDAAAPPGPVALTPYERASALSYFITNAPPDDELLQAAAGGGLVSREQLRNQAERLMAAPELAGGIRQLFDEALKVRTILTRTKDKAVFPDWSPELARDMVSETQTFVQHVLWNSPNQLSELLTARYSFVNERLAQLYGIQGVTGPELRRVDLPPERAGLLMQASFLAAEAKSAEGDIVHRGLRVVRDWFCQEIPPPPPDAGALPPRTEEPLTLRERVLRHKTDPRCAGCHELIDGPGYAFESFDGIGRFRVQDAGKAIETSGAFTAPTTSLSFANAAELTSQMASNADVQQCLVRRVFTYALGREPAADDACVLDELKRSLIDSGGNLRRVLAELAASEVLATRSK